MSDICCLTIYYTTIIYSENGKPRANALALACHFAISSDTSRARVGGFEEDDIVAADLDMHQLILNSEAHQAVVSKTKSSFYCVGLAKFMTFRIQ